MRARWAKVAAEPFSTGHTSALAVPPLAPKSPALKKPKPPGPGEIGTPIPPPAPLKTAGLFERAGKAIQRGVTQRQQAVRAVTDKYPVWQPLVGGAAAGAAMLPAGLESVVQAVVPHASPSVAAMALVGGALGAGAGAMTAGGGRLLRAAKAGVTGKVPHWAKTAKAHKLSRRMEFRGLQISIETDKGESRHWYDPHGKEKGSTKMKYPYGYIRMTQGVDGDHVDVYVGPNERAEKVYVVHQQKAPHFDHYDEDKCMLGFASADAAKKAYLAHYNNDRFFGSMTVMPFEQFKKKVLGTFKKPQKIAEVMYKHGGAVARCVLGLKTAADDFDHIDEDLTLAELLAGGVGLGATGAVYGGHALENRLSKDDVIRGQRRNRDKGLFG